MESTLFNTYIFGWIFVDETAMRVELVRNDHELIWPSCLLPRDALVRLGSKTKSATQCLAV